MILAAWFANLIALVIDRADRYLYVSAAKNVSPAPHTSTTSIKFDGKIVPLYSAPALPSVVIRQVGSGNDVAAARSCSFTFT